jgi:4-amino-4-deoxychorismate lyase
MSLLVETIRVDDGVPANLTFHNERIMRSMSDLFGIRAMIDLADILSVPADAKKGIFKCRVEYDEEIRKIEFLQYRITPVKRLKLVDGGDISYGYKFTDRKMIGKLMERRGECDDILIIKNGMVTDTSYANVVLLDQDGRWITPATYLLRGTRRAYLLKSGLIQEVQVGVNDLENYSMVKLINAMIGIEDTEGIPVEKILS